MSPSRSPLRRLLVAGACATAIVAGAAAGPAAADDRSLARTITERGAQLDKRDRQLQTRLQALVARPGQGRARSAGRDSAALYRTTNAFRTEVRDDDGSSDRGVQIRDAVLPTLTAMSAAAKQLDALLQSAAKRRRVTTSQVRRIRAAKLVLDRRIDEVVDAITEAFTDDGPVDPAPAPTDPTA